MRRAGLLTVVLVLALCGPTAAWVALPAHELGGGAVATCLRDAGDGRVSLLGPLTRTASSNELYAVGGPAGVAPPLRTTLGWLDECAAVGATGGGPVAYAGSARLGPSAPLALERPNVLRVADAGEPPVALAPRARTDRSGPALAVARDGAAVAAWVETRVPSRDPRSERSRVVAAVRAGGAGAAFGAPQALTAWRRAWEASARVGIDGAGRATVAYVLDQAGSPGAVSVVTSDPSGRFGGAQRLPSDGLGADPVALAVAEDGRALLAMEGHAGVQAYERPPGAGAFAPVPMADGAGSVGSDLTAALGPDGGAVLAWRGYDRGVFATTRPPGGAFGAVHVVVPERQRQVLGGASLIVATAGSRRPPVPVDHEAGRLAVALGPAGDVLLTWVTAGGRELAPGAMAAAGTLAGGFAAPERLSSPCRAADGARPVRLADGRLGAAWTDNASRSSLLGESPLGGGRLHVAVPGTAAPAPPAEEEPRASVKPAGARTSRAGDPLRVRVRCEGGRCDVRLVARARSVARDDDGRGERGLGRGGGFDDLPGAERARLATRSATLDPGTTRELRLVPEATEQLAPARGRGPGRIVVTTCTPDGRLADRRTVPARLVALRPFPVPVPLDVRARRTHSGAVRVTWRTARPARRASFGVRVDRARYDRRDYAARKGRGRTRFAATLRPRRPARVREIHLTATSTETGARREVSIRLT